MPTIPGESAVAGAPRRGRSAFRSKDGRSKDGKAGHGPGTVRRPRRALGSAVAHAPQVLRALVRADEIWLLVVAAGIGTAAGIAVWLINVAAQLLHQTFFGISATQRLSAMDRLSPVATVVVPCVGGLALGLITLAIARVYTRRAVDPIEANALFGGRMSLTGSLVVVLQTIISNGVGASIGLEAAYTQIGSAIASKVGHAFRVRRNDLRLLVGCGAAAAIAGAFNAPFTGAFYAFELVIGTYSIGTFGPVAVASLVSIGVVRGLGGELFELHLLPAEIDPLDYIPILALGMLCALLGITIMRGVTLTEGVFRRAGLPAWARPAIGGLAVGILALYTPAVLSSGHGALGVVIGAEYSLTQLVLLVILKALASAISIGSGFRGGLFFASLFLGAGLGKAFAVVVGMVSPEHMISPTICALVGMSGLAVAIIGGPLTMGFLSLEATGSLPMTVAVLAACVVSAVTVRRTFGYSFATWRFHLRGESIRSAVDIGWMRNLTVERMMRREVKTIHADMPLPDFKRDFSLGSEQRVVVLDDEDRYVGIVLVAEVYADADDDHVVGDLLHYVDTVLLPKMTIKEAVAMFENAESDALAVVDGPETRHVIGLLTEQHALRRYSEELDRRRRELSGE
jgi:chloride channel protein, CIC family